MARRIGASHASVEVSEGAGLSVSVRKGEIENVERNRDKSVGVSIYVGQRRGNASSSDFSAAALEQSVRAAHDIARFTAEDPAAGLPEAEDLATPAEVARDLDCSSPGISMRRVPPSSRKRCEDAAMAPTGASPIPKVRRCQPSSRTSGLATAVASAAAMPRRVTTFQSRRLPARAQACSATLGTARCATRTNSQRPRPLGRYAAERALSRLKSRKVSTCEVPVLFEAPVASGLLGAYVQATSGGALYRKASFLLDSLGQSRAGRASGHARRPAHSARQGQRTL